MKIEMTTKRLLHLLRDAYKSGHNDAMSGVLMPQVDNKSYDAAQKILMGHLWENESE